MVDRITLPGEAASGLKGCVVPADYTQCHAR
jgi:hypothetical protein